MKVWLLIHDDRDYDMGDMSVRGVFATEEAARASLVSRTPSGQKSRAWGAHDEWCCDVDGWEVAESPQPDVREDPPDVPQTGGEVIPAGFADAILDNLSAAPSDRLARMAAGWFG